MMSPSIEAVVPNIVVFGETGVGKSSLINMLARKEVAKVGNTARGCTFESTPYEIELYGKTFRVHDTAGLNEGSKGAVPPDQAIAKLHHLIRDLQGGLNLLVYVIRGPRITASTERNYGLFFRAFCRKKVPIVAVITGMENEPCREHWWTVNEPTFREFSMQFDGQACITATKGIEDRLAEDYSRSSADVRMLVWKTYAKTGWSMEARGWLITSFKEIYIAFAAFFGLKVMTKASASLAKALINYAYLNPKEAKRRCMEAQKECR